MKNRRARLAVYVLNIAAALSLLMAFAVYLDTFRGSLQAPSDFTAYFLASRSLELGLDPYQRATLEEMERAEGIEGDIGPYLYPPFFALAISPLTSLGHTTARIVWAFLSILLFGGSILLLVRSGQFPIPTYFWLPLATFAFLFPPAYDDLLKGQVTILLLFLLSLTYFLARKSIGLLAPSTGLAGIALGLATIIKLAPAILCLYFLVKGQWKIVAGAVVTFVLLLVATTIPWSRDTTFVSRGIGDHWEYITEIIPSIRLQYADPANASVTGFLYRLLTANPYAKPIMANEVLAASLSLLVITIIMVISIIVWAKAAGKRSYDLSFGLGIVVLLLVSPTSQTYTLTLALLPLFLFLRWLALQPRLDFRLFDGLLVAALLLSLPPTVRLRQEGPLLNLLQPHILTSDSILSFALASANFLGLVLCFLLGLALLRKAAGSPAV